MGVEEAGAWLQWAKDNHCLDRHSTFYCKDKARLKELPEEEGEDQVTVCFFNKMGGT